MVSKLKLNVSHVHVYVHSLQPLVLLGCLVQEQIAIGCHLIGLPIGWITAQLICLT